LRLNSGERCERLVSKVEQCTCDVACTIPGQLTC